MFFLPVLPSHEDFVNFNKKSCFNTCLISTNVGNGHYYPLINTIMKIIQTKVKWFNERKLIVDIILINIILYYEIL